MIRVPRALRMAPLLLALAAGRAAADSIVPADSSAALSDAAPAPAGPVRSGDGLEHLVPALAGNPYRLEEGPRPFLHRLAFSPGYGRLGSETLFTFRFAYSPNDWLAYEGALGHNPGQSVHAVLHTVSAIVRHPIPGRFQPYASGGYGMVMVFPGRSINADPVTKNALTVGGGLEIYIRGDLALRADLQHATVFGRERNREGTVAFSYLQQSIGLAFYRAVGP